MSDRERFGGDMSRNEVEMDLSKSAVDSGLIPCASNYEWYGERKQAVINKGLQMGTILGRKLKIRNEETSLKSTRRDTGRIDKRLIAELGFNNDRVFKTTLTERYNDAFIHISIDGSGSMDGEYLESAIKSTAAICQAATMAGNIHVQVTLRTTISINGNAKPLMVVLYDSSVNKIVHIKK